MLTFIILFFLSLSVIIILVGLKIAEIRQGQTIIGPIVERKIIENIIKPAKKKILQNLLWYFHIFITLLIRIWFKLYYGSKRKLSHLKKKIKSLTIHRHPKREIPESGFWKTIAEYHKKIKKIAEDVKKEEMGNEE